MDCATLWVTLVDIYWKHHQQLLDLTNKMELAGKTVYSMNSDYEMAIKLFNFIIDELSELKTNNDGLKLSKYDKNKKNLLIKALHPVEIILNDIHQYHENYEIRVDKVSDNATSISPLTLMLEALKIELTKLDKLPNDDKFVEISKTRRRNISNALPPLKKLASHIAKS